MCTAAAASSGVAGGGPDLRSGSANDDHGRLCAVGIQGFPLDVRCLAPAPAGGPAEPVLLAADRTACFYFVTELHGMAMGLQTLAYTDRFHRHTVR